MAEEIDTTNSATNMSVTTATTGANITTATQPDTTLNTNAIEVTITTAAIHSTIGSKITKYILGVSFFPSYVENDPTFSNEKNISFLSEDQKVELVI